MLIIIIDSTIKELGKKYMNGYHHSIELLEVVYISVQLQLQQRQFQESEGRFKSRYNTQLVLEE